MRCGRTELFTPHQQLEDTELRHRAPANESGNDGDRKQHDRHKEHDLRRFDGNSGNAAETKQRGNERNDEKCDGPA